ncbi:MAG: LCP family protein [Solibacillus sp.]
MEQKTRYKKKRVRKGRVIVTALFLVIVALIGYSYVEYQNGLKLASETKVPAEDFIADETTHKVETFLILGVDSRGEEKSRTDTMMLLTWDRETNDMRLVSFMRDIYAEIPGYQSYKLNTAYYLGGVQLLKETLNNMFDLPIHHYAIIDFKSFESLIDILAPNGIEVDVEKRMSGLIYMTIEPGVQQLNGSQLLGYARYRGDAEGDFGRVERQQKVIELLKEELLSPTNMKNIPKFVGAAQGYVTSDMSSAAQLKMALSMITSGAANLQKMTIPAEHTYSFQTYSHAGSVIEMDIEQNKEMLHTFLKLDK